MKAASDECVPSVIDFLLAVAGSEWFVELDVNILATGSDNGISFLVLLCV
jgi:hypothetical protein